MTEIPKHHSSVQHIMNKYHSRTYVPLATLEEAKEQENGVVVLEGDWGGIIYATCPVKHLHDAITHDDIVSLCKTVEYDHWGYGARDIPKEVPAEGGPGVYYQCVKPGGGVWGGSGGGKVIDGLWVHSKLTSELRRQITQVLLGK
jgi:hypothetical protein